MSLERNEPSDAQTNFSQEYHSVMEHKPSSIMNSREVSRGKEQMNGDQKVSKISKRHPVVKISLAARECARRITSGHPTKGNTPKKCSTFKSAVLEPSNPYDCGAGASSGFRNQEKELPTNERKATSKIEKPAAKERKERTNYENFLIYRQQRRSFSFYQVRDRKRPPENDSEEIDHQHISFNRLTPSKDIGTTSHRPMPGTPRPSDSRGRKKRGVSGPTEIQRLSPHPSCIPPSMFPSVIGYRVVNLFGMRVSIVDEFYKVLVVDFVPPQTCDLITNLTNLHIEVVNNFSRHVETWRTLYTYTKMDLPCCEVPNLPLLTNEIMSLVTRIIGEAFHAPFEASCLRPRSWREPHLLRYQKLAGVPEHKGVDLHYDGSHFTWQLMLSDLADYDGGGTFFPCLGKTIKLKKGQVLIHPGSLFHKGLDITRGVRNLLVCFMDGFDPKIGDHTSGNVEEDWHENQVVTL